mmetsp:Transcript_10385/g.47653  ORF Transcript_10385/g.47653 Transcript_10385/m.47653 type:complete len:263 (+) Transcript_10385:4365-5153(+)
MALSAQSCDAFCCLATWARSASTSAPAAAATAAADAAMLTPSVDATCSATESTLASSCDIDVRKELVSSCSGSTCATTALNSASPRRVNASCLSATKRSSRRTRSDTAVAAASAAATAAALAPSMVASTALPPPGPPARAGEPETPRRLPGDEDSDDSMALDAAAAATALRSSGGAGSVVGGTGSGSGDGAGTGAGADLSFFSFLPGFSSLAGALNFFSESGTVATGFGAGGEGLLAGTGMSGAGGRVTRGGSTGTATAGSG